MDKKFICHGECTQYAWQSRKTHLRTRSFHHIFLLAMIVMVPLASHAETTGRQGLGEIKQCIMQNDTVLCHQTMTPSSYPIFDKFSGYRLMPCLPTDFSYKSEHKSGDETIVKASMPEDSTTNYEFRLVFVKDGGGQVKLDLPETLHIGLGDNWQDKLNTSEQIFLMMKQNMQDKLTCDVLLNLVKPDNG